MRLFEGLFLWSGIVFYLLGFLLFLTGLIFKKERLFVPAWIVSVTGFVFHNLTIITRWLESGHPPFYGTYEHFLAQCWFFMAIFFAVSAKSGAVRRLGVGILPLCVLLLGYGIMGGDTGTEPLPPPYQSAWLWVHAVSWFGYGAFFIAAITSALFLIKAHGLLDKLPALDELDRMTKRMIVFGFVTLAIGMGAGAIWAHGLWGRYWAWDPVETWTLITWLIYGLNIHLRVSYGWKGRKSAWLAVFSIISVIITLGGIGFSGGVHTTLL
jgi:ABC-type transport system involved in cytochrome c biogenesis permease subunit